MENFTFNTEDFFGYKFHIATTLDFAFDAKRKMLLVIDENNDYLNGVVYFYELEQGKVKIKFKPRGGFVFEVVEKEVYIYNLYTNLD